MLSPSTAHRCKQIQWRLINFHSVPHLPVQHMLCPAEVSVCPGEVSITPQLFTDKCACLGQQMPYWCCAGGLTPLGCSSLSKADSSIFEIACKTTQVPPFLLSKTWLKITVCWGSDYSVSSQCWCQVPGFSYWEYVTSTQTLNYIGLFGSTSCSVHVLPLKLVVIYLHPHSEISVTLGNSACAQTTSWKTSSLPPRYIIHHMHFNPNLKKTVVFSTPGKMCHTTVACFQEMSREKCFSDWNSTSQVGHILLFTKHEFVSSDKALPPVNYLHLQMRKQAERLCDSAPVSGSTRSNTDVPQRHSHRSVSDRVGICCHHEFWCLPLVKDCEILSFLPLIFLFPWFPLASTPYTTTFGFNLKELLGLFTRASLWSLSI